MAEYGEGWVAKLLGGLRRLAGIFGGKAASSYIRAFDGLRGALLEIGSATANFIEENRSWLASLIGIFRRFYSGGLLPLIRWLRDKFLSLQAWLKKVFQPLFDFLLRLRRELRDFYAKFVRPVLDVIEAIQFSLRVLGRFGVEWAQALDAKLEIVKRAITERYLEVLGKLNEAIDWIHDIRTLDGLFQRIPLLRSLDRDAGFWIRLWWNKQIAAGGDTPLPPRTGPKFTRRPVELDMENLGTFARGHGGPIAPVVEELGLLMFAFAKGAGSEKPED